MRIAMITPPWISVPPHGYGGIEWVVSLLVEELVASGHDVTLFASGGSVTKAELISVFSEPPTSRMHANVPDARHAQRAIAEIAARHGTDRAFDVIHDHSAAIFLAAAPLMPAPMVHTIHGAFTDEMKALYAAVASDVSFVAISRSQADTMPELNVAAVVPNAVDVGGFPLNRQKSNYLLCLGRVCRDKGQDVAVQVAKRVDMPIIFAGKVDPGDDTAYFQEEILPHLDGQHVMFEGEVTDERKRELVANAYAMLFPIRWPEPFGLVMIEGMASGTPVIAMRAGAAPEVVTDGVTGFIVDDADGMVEALSRVSEIDPAVCRAEAENRFSPRVMAEGYLRVYDEAISRRNR